jgi:conjugative relaxase-like TrwC/TraI family protein
VAAVLSVAKLTVGQEAYYEQQVARGVDDYYAGRGESPGIWSGSAAACLGLAGVVEDGSLGTLLRGVDPASGDRLRAPVPERTINVRVLDRETGEWRDEQKRLAALSGYDLVFSCPKSVSLLHALSEDELVRHEVSEAHESAWQAALAYLEREACVVRRGHGGVERERGGGFVVAAFRHRTSRAQDPHLHTHVIVANMTQAPDGEWRALDGEPLLRTYRLAAGYLYEAQLRHELSGRLGLDWTQPVKGMAELEGVPEQAIRAFSKRRESLLEHMEARGTRGFAAARVAALATRERKEEVDLARLREDWRARASEYGLGSRELRQLLGPPHPARAIDLDELAERLLGHDGLTARQTTFTTPELVRAIAGGLPTGAQVESVREAADELARFPAIELLEQELSPGRPARFTTRDLLDVEREALEVALDGRNADAPRAFVKPDTLLSREQRTLVREACLRPDRVVCVVGVAGAGKTTALRALADGYTEAGIPVLGAAPSGRAADELAAATRIRSATMHRLLLDARRDGGLPHGSVLVVDEAGMAETRVLGRLLRLVDDADGKAILVGDPGQLPAVGAGGLFAALCDQLGALELTQNRRQLDAHERAALIRLRAGNPEPYLAHAAASGRLHVVADAIAAKHRLVEDWWRAASPEPARTIMLAYRRHDVRELNDAARALMRASGQLGDRALMLGKREFRVGDRIVCRRNDARLDLRNGLRGTVVDLDPATRMLTLQTDARTQRAIPARYATNHLDYGYALTGHAAQGATVDRAFVLLRDDGALREWGYVACSRARLETRLYAAGDAIEREHHGRPVDASDPTARLAGALERSTAEEVALAQRRPGASDVSRRAFECNRSRHEQALATAEQRLSAAEEKLRDLGRLRHRRKRFELQAEAARERATVRLARKRLASMPLEPPERPVPPRRPSLARARPALDRGDVVDRGRSLEL